MGEDARANSFHSITITFCKSSFYFIMTGLARFFNGKVKKPAAQGGRQFTDQIQPAVFIRKIMTVMVSMDSRWLMTTAPPARSPSPPMRLVII